MKRYFIDNTQGSGSGCDKFFATKEAAEFHMQFYTEEEREGLEIAEMECHAVIVMEGDDSNRHEIAVVDDNNELSEWIERIEWMNDRANVEFSYYVESV